MMHLYTVFTEQYYGIMPATVSSLVEAIALIDKRETDMGHDHDYPYPVLKSEPFGSREGWQYTYRGHTIIHSILDAKVVRISR